MNSLFYFKKREFLCFLCLAFSYLGIMTSSQGNPKSNKKEEKKVQIGEEMQEELQGSLNFQGVDDFKGQAQELYHRALVFYQEGDFEKAREFFGDALRIESEHPWILYNLGLTEFQLENSFMALALWRKSLFLSPLHPYARQAMKIPLNGLKETKDSSLWDLFRSKILSYFSLNFILITSLIFFSISGFLFVRRYRLYKEEQEGRDRFKWVPLLSFFVYFLCLLFFSLGGMKFFDVFHPRATVIVESTALRVGPKEEDNVLLTLKGGEEVILKKKEKEWSRVISERGAAGWVMDSDLFQTSGRFF